MQNSCSEQLFGKLTGRSTSVHKKNSTIDILLGITQKLLGELFFFNTQIDGCFWKRTVLLEKLLWCDKRMKPFKTCVTQERVEGKLTKAVTKSDVGGGVAAKKKWCHPIKKRDFESEVLFEWPLWCWLILLFFYECICWWCY